MDSKLWLALIAAALGTFLMRLLPLLYMRRHLARKDRGGAGEAMPAWLGVLGPAMIAAMFGTSLVPAAASAASWSATAIGLLSTFLTWRWTRSLGWPILAGVAAYGLTVIIARVA